MAKITVQKIGVRLFSIALPILIYVSNSEAQDYPDQYDRRLNSMNLRSLKEEARVRDGHLELKQSIPNVLFDGGQDYLTPFTVLARSGNLGDMEGQAFLEQHASAFGITTDDIQLELTDRVVTKATGVVHEYYRQVDTRSNLPVFYTHANFNHQNGKLLLANVGLVAVSQAVVSSEPAISPAEALSAAADFFGHPPEGITLVDTRFDGARRTATLEAPFLDEPVEAELGLLPVSSDSLEPVWMFKGAWFADGPLYDLTVSASGQSFVNGPADRVVTALNNESHTAFRAYSYPTESPIHTSPQPPTDARVLVQDPEDSDASPSGWFNGSSGALNGNNVLACSDRNGSNSCDSGAPVCANQVCDFPINLNADPRTYTDAAIVNLFYWNNIIHDVQWQYGFDESAGNFQENNFGRGGSGSDSVNAQAQDNANGGSRCNANFATPADGSNPRMQMFVCDRASPLRDGDFDNGVIVHEYGHGISTRQVGGPSRSCLTNRQQAGEGWSDILALIYTAESGDRATDSRGVGSYLFGLAPTESIRPQVYSTSQSLNNYTYESMNGLSVPHGVGSVWAQVTWEMYWRLVDLHGFEQDLENFDVNDSNEAGNKRALFYINEGLKNTSCSPTFIANRNGILAAAESAFNGEDVCAIWEVFAEFGIGENANSGGANSTSPSNGFELPSECDGGGPPPPPPPPPPPLACPDGSDPIYAAGFESGANGWTQGNDSCSTGSFVVGTPTQTNDGVVIQVAGAAEGSNAFFTATNTSAGVDDVDNGTCEALSPVINAGGEDAVDVFVSYFHGQRDGGDDGSDGFTLQVLNNGSVAATPVNIGDVSSSAEWTAVSANVNNPGNIQIRARATDGAGEGDLVEAGVDRILVCSAQGTTDPTPGECSVEEDFESGVGGWVNSSASTCTTGAFVSDTPSEQTNEGVTTQVGGAASGSNAYFTATNSSAGVNDVDGGNCITQSPSYSVSSASTLEISYFHGQRDANDDGSDFFQLEVSTDGGASFSTIASNGDTISNAAWSTATADISAGANVVVRVQCSDGSGEGDLVECGVDNLSICSN